MNTIQLKNKYQGKEQFVSDFEDKLPTAKGLHFISAGTGCGKTGLMTRKCQYNAVAVFPVKALGAQQRIKAGKEKRNLITLQLEKFVNYDFTKLCQLDAIYIDEIQLIYQSGFRTSTVNRLFNLIDELRKHIPVYCLSGTYRMEFSPLIFDTITTFNKDQFQRNVNVLISNSYEEDILHNGVVIGEKTLCAISMDDIIFHIKEATRQGIPVLFFNNNDEQNIKITKILNDDGISAMSCSSNGQSDVDAFQKLIKDEEICGIDKQVVLTTCMLAEGLNINDSVHIMCTQDSPEVLIQQFGRARNYELGIYTLLISTGESSWCNDYTQSVLNKALDIIDPWAKDQYYRRMGVDFPLHYIESDIQRNMIMKYCVKGKSMREPRYGYYVASTLITDHGLDVQMAGGQGIDSDIQLPNGIKSTLVEAFTQTNDVLDIQQMLILKHDISVLLADVYIDKAHCFRDNYKKLAFKTKDWVQAFRRLYTIDMNFLSFLSYRGLIDIAGEKIRDSASKIQRINSNDIQSYADDFFIGLTDGVCDIDDIEHEGMRKRLFIHLTGIKDSTNGFYSMPIEKQWWDVVLAQGAESVRFTKRKKLIDDANIKLGDFCEATQMNKKDIAESKPKIIKSHIIDIEAELDNFLKDVELLAILK